MRVNLIYRVISGVAIFVAALGLVGLAVSEEDRVSSAVMIGAAVLVWMAAYAMRSILAPRLKQSSRKQR